VRRGSSTPSPPAPFEIRVTGRPLGYTLPVVATIVRTITHVEGPRQPRGASPVLVLALECARPLAGSLRCDLRDVDSVTLGRAEQRATERGEAGIVRHLKIGVPDRWMSSAHARMTRVMGTWLLEDCGSKNGTRVNGAPCSGTALADGDVVEVGHTFLVFRVAAAPALVKLDAEVAPGGDDVRTLSWPLQDQLERVETVARSDVPVLIQGETGTGKELVARAVHRLSGRRGAFVAVNCGALPENLVEAQLFGSRKGAFTGAQEDREGFVRSAHGGTLFLDEIGDLPVAAQPALLRVLQEHEVTPVGETRPRSVDFRLVAATHRDLAQMEASGAFRGDLLARISGLPVRLPPLREHREDLGLLVGTLLSKTPGTRDLQLTCEAGRALFARPWPMNVRELEQCLNAARALAADGAIDVSHFPRAEPQATSEVQRAPRPLSDADVRQRDDLVALLREHGGSVSAVARATGKARMQIQRWMKRFGLDPATFRS
jgi:transcriptional regulator with AAA-type ATPase domain